MSLEEEINVARKEIISDGYDMSIGEIINLYDEHELKIDPEFQRLFRWDVTRKTRFIESILLGIPIPPIFVYQDDNGIWELIDGLQRLSTILEFCGKLKDGEGNRVEPSTLEGTKFLPSLTDKTWNDWNNTGTSISKILQLQIKRARIRVEILLKESDENAKYELFQRLNTGGSPLSEQEVRNCIAFMINKDFFNLLKELSTFNAFTNTTCQTENAIERQSNVELVLRFISFRHHSYKNGLDVHEYLDESLVEIAKSSKINWEDEKELFEKTFTLLDMALGENSFKKWDGNKFKGMFLMSVYETIAIGVSENINDYDALSEGQRISKIKDKAKALWKDTIFEKSSGAGVRATTRLKNLLPLGKELLKP